jgi:hypothetical protein
VKDIVNTRVQMFVPRVYQDQIHHKGLVIDLYGNFTNSTLIVIDNQFYSIQNHVEGYFKNKTLYHCINILEDMTHEPLIWNQHDQKTIVGERNIFYF